ncbi:MAG TPA: hypothetical protein VGN64_02130 [Dyadobacter sp.]|jgi:hypothetical protein|nr:hypothetical protein [Dyadobacter sp.]
MPEEWRCTPQKSYGVLGWIESAIKFLAGVAAVISMMSFVKQQEPAALSIPRIIQTAILGAIELWYIFQIVHRFAVGELFAIGFAFFQVLTHFFIFLPSLLTQDPGAYMFMYGFLMILGHITALLFLCLRDESELELKWLSKKALNAMNVILMLLYAGLFVLQIILFVGGFPGDVGL